jgi:hypothetical protein
LLNTKQSAAKPREKEIVLGVKKVKGKRGRPKKVITSELDFDVDSQDDAVLVGTDNETDVVPVKRGRGRPKKPRTTEIVTRKRGRPSKNNGVTNKNNGCFDELVEISTLKVAVDAVIINNVRYSRSESRN